MRAASVVIASIILLVLVSMAFGAIYYFGLPVLGFDIGYGQAVVLAILVWVTGNLFGITANKGDE